MKNQQIIIKLIALLLITPTFSLAATTPGIKPGSLFYFLDTTAEDVSLFFTFNPEKRVRKTLEYADERLAEAEAVAEENNPEAVKTAISNYENKIASAAKESKEVTDEKEVEKLLILIIDTTSKNQEVLNNVLGKVPEEAKQAIVQAIEVSRKGQEEATRQITELKSEVEQLKKEVAELKVKDEAQTKIVEELNRQKSESVPAPIKSSAPPTTDTIQNSKPEFITPPLPQAEEEKKKSTNITTLPNGAVVEMDANGNVVRYIKEAPTLVPTPTPTSTIIPNVSQIQIISVNVVPTLNTAAFEWTTNSPAESRVFIKSPEGVVSVFQSISGFSTKHIVNATGLISNTQYTYEIEAVDNQKVVKKSGTFQTLKEMIPPKVSLPGWTATDGQLSYPDPNFPGYGSVNKNCKNCMVISADEPVRITLYYANFDSIEEKRKVDIGWSSSDLDRAKIIAEEIAKPGILLIHQFNELKEWHQINYDILPGLEKNKRYIFKFEAADAAGNMYQQKFTGSYGLPIKWSVNQILRLVDFTVYTHIVPTMKIDSSIMSIKINYPYPQDVAKIQISSPDPIDQYYIRDVSYEIISDTLTNQDIELSLWQGSGEKLDPKNPFSSAIPSQSSKTLTIRASNVSRLGKFKLSISAKFFSVAEWNREFIPTNLPLVTPEIEIR